MEVTSAWLENLNKKYRSQDVHPAKRPLDAISEWSLFTRREVRLDSDEAKFILNWFKNNTKPGSQAMGPYFKGLYYFDAEFWELLIPMVYGCAKLDLFYSFPSMPDGIKEALKANKNKLHECGAVWIDCLDYAYGYGDIVDCASKDRVSLGMLKSGNKELTATVSLTLEKRPNGKAVESARMGTEIFLKSLLIEKAGWTEAEVKSKIGHDLHKAVEECKGFMVDIEVSWMKAMVARFPSIHARYQGQDIEPRKIWEAYLTVQSTASMVMRILSGRDNRGAMKGNYA
ncbi:MAG: hypothetical protein HGA87_02090 [Desulfobulbaceae bacterium]|nr:hypothetical protein [Desulfobulbaceae bacterium]